MSRNRTRFYAIAEGGRKYHTFPGCSGLNANAMGADSVHEITSREIRRRKLEPCQACKPSPMMTVVREAAS